MDQYRHFPAITLLDDSFSQLFSSTFTTYHRGSQWNLIHPFTQKPGRMRELNRQPLCSRDKPLDLLSSRVTGRAWSIGRPKRTSRQDVNTSDQMFHRPSTVLLTATVASSAEPRWINSQLGVHSRNWADGPLNKWIVKWHCFSARLV